MDTPRRAFLKFLLILTNGCLAALVGVPVLGYIVAPIARKREAMWVELGPADDIKPGPPVRRRIRYLAAEGFSKRLHNEIVWVTRNEDEFIVFSSVCPHLGCNVNWNPEAGEYACPCHDGKFSADGSRLSGPPPRGLRRHPARVEDGRVMVEV